MSWTVFDPAFLLSVSHPGGGLAPLIVYEENGRRHAVRQGPSYRTVGKPNEHYRCVAAEQEPSSDLDHSLIWQNGLLFGDTDVLVPTGEGEHAARSSNGGCTWKAAAFRDENDALEATAFAKALYYEVDFARMRQTANANGTEIFGQLTNCASPVEAMALVRIRDINERRGARDMISVVRTLFTAIVKNAEEFFNRQSEALHCAAGGTRESFFAPPPPAALSIPTEEVWLTAAAPLSSFEHRENLSCVGLLNGCGPGCLGFDVCCEGVSGAGGVSSTERVTLYNTAIHLAALLAGRYVATRAFGSRDAANRGRPRLETSVRNLRFSVGDFTDGTEVVPAIAVSWPERVPTNVSAANLPRPRSVENSLVCGAFWGFMLVRMAMAFNGELSIGARSARWPLLAEAMERATAVAGYWCMGQEESDETLLQGKSHVYGYIESILRGNRSERARDYVRARHLGAEAFGPGFVPRHGHQAAAAATLAGTTGNAARAGDSQTVETVAGKRTISFAEQCETEFLCAVAAGRVPLDDTYRLPAEMPVQRQKRLRES